MIYEGFSAALVAWILNALALSVGVFLGARGLLDPKWAARLVRLTPDEQGGGFAEFRATYGGVFLGLHAAALAFSLGWIARGGFPAGLCALGASAALSAGWFGACAGRLLSMARDNTRTPFNKFSALFEFVIALLIGAPWFFWGIAISE